MSHVGHIFGYGSLFDPGHLQTYLGRDLLQGTDFHFCSLKNYRRHWNIAMDNAVDIPGYKYYVDLRTGDRPNVVVTYLNIVEESSSLVNGIVFRVQQDELAKIDQRERNYSRSEVSEKLSVALPKPVWAYVGLPEARQRFEEAFRQNRAVISRGYFESVVRSFKDRDSLSYDMFLETTEAPGIPLKDLARKESL